MWNRISIDNSDGTVTGHFVDAGSRFLLSGRYQRGMSIWEVDSTNALFGRALGKTPSERVKKLGRRVEIYFAPGTLEVMDPRDLAGFSVEECERPPKDDVALLVGDQSDWTDLWP
jgi:hypothetical protein